MNTHNIPFSIYKENHPKYPIYSNVCSYCIFSLGTQERVRNSCGKLAIGVRVTEVLLYRGSILPFSFLPPFQW